MLIRKAIFIVALAAVYLMGCDNSIWKMQSRRADRAENATGDIVIGIVGTSAPPNFFMNGVDLAVEEINNRGGLLGRQIKTIKYDDRGEVKRGQSIARKLVDNPDVVAVVGHFHSKVAIPVSITYSTNGILFLTPGASNPLLTKPGAEGIIRNVPTDTEIGKQLADFARDEGYQSIAVFFQRDEESKILADAFLEQAAENGIRTASTRSFSSWQNDFKPVLAKIKQLYEFDCLFIAGLLPSAGHLIQQARNMGITVPILGGDGLDSPSLMTIAGKEAEGVVVSTFFNPGLHRRETRDFVNRFQAAFGFGPDTQSAQGYDAINQLAYAIEQSASTVPIIMDSTLKYVENWEGVTGSYSFTPQGDITGKSIFFKQVRNENFVYLNRGGEEKEISLFDYAKDFTLRIPLGKAIPTIDPGRAGHAASIEVVAQLFLGLTALDAKTYEAVPELATHWHVSEDGKTVTFYLREDARWTNGNVVTADEVVWAVRRNFTLAEQSPTWYLLRILKNAEAIHRGEITDVSQLGVSAPDKFTVTFSLEHAAPYFPSIAGLWNFRPLPRETILKYGERWTDPGNIQTNGAYRLALWEKGVGMVLSKNMTYYDAARVSIPEVRYFLVPDGSIGLAMYEKDELDILGSSYLPIPSGEIPRIRANPDLANGYSTAPDFCTYAYVFNTSLDPVADPLVRKAISAALNRQLMVGVMSGGGEPIATTFACPGVFGAVAPEENAGISFDPGQAKKWLAAAGFPNGEGFPAITLLYNRSGVHAGYARAVKASLAHFLNIEVNLLEMQWADYYRRVTQGQPPHMFLWQWCADYPDADNFLDSVFNPSDPLIRTTWKNPGFADLMALAEQTLDPGKRKAFYKLGEQILCEQEAVVVPVFFVMAHSLVTPRIDGWTHMAIGGQHIQNWSFREQ